MFNDYHNFNHLTIYNYKFLSELNNTSKKEKEQKEEKIRKNKDINQIKNNKIKNDESGEKNCLIY